MAALQWEPTAVKAHLRLTSQRLGQLQAKLDSHGNITRKDIATLLQQGNVGLARAKAQKLIQEDAHGDLLETLEMELGTLLEHVKELDASDSPTTNLAEAISSVIYAAPHIHCRELDIVRKTLILRFGPDFAHAATTNRENHVPPRIFRALNTPLPSASLLNRYLMSVARSYGVDWLPDPERHDILNVLSEMLNADVSQEIDVNRLRKLCAYGLPDEPSWLRPRVWKLFFGILPPKQSEWKKEISKQRGYYYELVKRLLKPYDSNDLSTTSSTESEALDEALLNIFKHISRIPRQMFSHLGQCPESFIQNPLAASAEEALKISYANALDRRLKVLREDDNNNEAATSIPETSISADNGSTPGISLSDFDDDEKSESTQTLIESKNYSFGNAHPLHCSAILRLLFIHASINPGKLSPHAPALLVPLYTALLQEVEPEELAHVEADTFWLFEAIVSEISELDEEDISQKWMANFDSVLAWADPELHTDLQRKGLHPALPHYSYRWLAPLLTYTVPLPSILLVWDTIFSRLPRERDDNFKLDFLVDITSSMLIALRKELLGLGQTSTSSLWNTEGLAPELATRELTTDGDAFLEGISMLQAYPLTSLQDMERILQCANDLNNRRELEKRASQPTHTQTLGARLKNTMWKGFTNQIGESSEESPESDSDHEKRGDDGNETERPAQASGFNLISVLGGLRPKPTPPAKSQSRSSQPAPFPVESTGSSPAAGLWNYAEKLKDSDTIATLSKAGTNWRAKAVAVGGGWGRNSTLLANNGQSPSIYTRFNGGSDHRPSFGNGDRRDTIMISDHNEVLQNQYQTPSHDSALGYYSSSSNSSSLTPSPISPDPGSTQGSFVNKTISLLSIPKSQSPTVTKRSPRPLLLNLASPITSPPAHIRSGSDHLKTPDSSEWAEVAKMKKRYIHRDSQSSTSSLSPSEALKSGRSDWDSDTGVSRIVPLNRRSISPMAPGYRLSQPYPPRKSPASEPFSPSHLGLFKIAQSPTRSAPPAGFCTNLKPHPPSPIPDLPPVPDHSEGNQSKAPISQKFIANNPDVSESTAEDTDSWQLKQISRNPRVRSKKHPQRPAHLQIQDTHPKGSPAIEQKTPSPSRAKLTVDWPADDSDIVATPRATDFEGTVDEATPQRSVSPRVRRQRQTSAESRDRVRKSSADATQETRSRKLSSTGVRPPKVSSGDRESKRHDRDSAAEEGDDEGYDELLSAYESEDDPKSLRSN